MEQQQGAGARMPERAEYWGGSGPIGTLAKPPTKEPHTCHGMTLYGSGVEQV